MNVLLESLTLDHIPCSNHRRGRSAFTLIEMLTTVAILVIAMGLMVSLARYVRDRSARELTGNLLIKLDLLMQQYIEHNRTMPDVTPLLGPDLANVPPPPVLTEIALRNNRETIPKLVLDYRLHHPGPDADPFLQQPISVYDAKAQTLRDAWGSPIVFMPGQHPLIGLAPSRSGGKDQYFFVSAGPDRDYLTRDDNLYSYETVAAE